MKFSELQRGTIIDNKLITSKLSAEDDKAKDPVKFPEGFYCGNDSITFFDLHESGFGGQCACTYDENDKHTLGPAIGSREWRDIVHKVFKGRSVELDHVKDDLTEIVDILRGM